VVQSNSKHIRIWATPYDAGRIRQRLAAADGQAALRQLLRRVWGRKCMVVGYSAMAVHNHRAQP
jgi:hypothetical protein